MFARQLINLTRNFSSSSRHPSIVNNYTKLCPLNGHSTRFYSIDCKDESSPVKTDEKKDRMMKLIKLEMENLREDGRYVPDLNFIKKRHWSEMLKLDSKSARRKYYHYLFVTQMNVESRKAKKQQRALDYAAFKEQQANEGKAHPPKFLMRIYPQTINKWRNNRLFRAMQFSEKLVFDCSYDEYMIRKEAKAAARQLVRVFAENRRNRDPFDLHFCNVNFNNTTFERIQSHIPTLRDKAFPLHLHETSYLDVFPKDKLVYLTPHCKTDLTDYDPDAVYIIGAMVDLRNHEPLSMMKAKTLGIKMAKLPLERYLDWGHGDKTLTFDQMLKIMLEWRATNSWEKALKHVPRRKLKTKDVDVRKWTVYANELTTNYRNKNSFDNGSDSTRNDASGLSTADKFKRRPGTFNQFSYQSSFDNGADSTGNDVSGLSTADKFKRKPGTFNQFSYQSSFDNGADSTGNDVSGLSTADKFKRKPGTFNQFSYQSSFDNGADSTGNDVSGLSTADKFKRRPGTYGERRNFDSSRTDGISDKVKKSNRTGSKLRVDIQKLFDE